MIIQTKDDIPKQYDSTKQEEGNGENGTSMDNLKERLDAIRKNKLLLESKIKEYEKKLGK